MGLVNRLSEPGEALADAVTLAHELAELPPICMRNDLRSSKEQWGLSIDDALVRETELGRRPS